MTGCWKDYAKKGVTCEKNKNCSDEALLELGAQWILCACETLESYTGLFLIMRGVLLFLAFLLVKRDMDSMFNSLYLIKKEANSTPAAYNGCVKRLSIWLFYLYSAARAYIIYLGAMMLAVFCLGEAYFGSPLDLCMNFAALGFIYEIDELIVSINYFVNLKQKYKLLDDLEFPNDEVESIGTIFQFINCLCLDRCKRIKSLLRQVGFGTWTCILIFYLNDPPKFLVVNRQDFERYGCPPANKLFKDWNRYDDEWYVRGAADERAKSFAYCMLG